MLGRIMKIQTLLKRYLKKWQLDFLFKKTAETANSVEGSSTSATISIESTVQQADSKTQIAVSALESLARVGANTMTNTNSTSNVGPDGSRRGGM
uniref:Uncharacterized protein n=1 Tax=Meloidogyne hapla TaxID=6305 RepID=A0A1I8BDH3_MELHA